MMAPVFHPGLEEKNSNGVVAHGVQSVSYGGCQRQRIERLSDAWELRVRFTFNQILQSTARHVHHREVLMERLQLPHEYQTVHAGHHDIGQQQVYADVAPLADLKGLCAAVHCKDSVSVAIQNDPYQFQHAGLVVHNQDSLRFGHIHDLLCHIRIARSHALEYRKQFVYHSTITQAFVGIVRLTGLLSRRWLDGLDHPANRISKKLETSHPIFERLHKGGRDVPRVRPLDSYTPALAG